MISMRIRLGLILRDLREELSDMEELRADSEEYLGQDLAWELEESIKRYNRQLDNLDYWIDKIMTKEAADETATL